MRTTLHFNSEMGGGIIVIEPDMIALIDDDALYSLNIAVDPQGSADIVCDYPNQNWSQVWMEQTQLLAQMAKQGKMALAITSKASYKVVLDIKEDGAQSKVEASVYKQQLQVHSGKIAVIEAGYFTETKFSGEDPQDYETIPVANGSYLVTFSKQSNANSVESVSPEILVQIVPMSSYPDLKLSETLPYIEF